MWSQGRVVDCGLAKRAVVRSLRPDASPVILCDAQPYLLRAARHFGEPTERLCPVCERENVTNVTYVYGRFARDGHAGQAEVSRNSRDMAHDYDEFRVYVVEVCQGCSWNHLTVSFVLGNGPP